jgi:protein-glutamine gamma-glutamyltransferase
MNAITLPALDIRLERIRLNWVLAAFAVMLLPHALHLPPWVTLATIAISVWRLAVAYRGWPLFSRGARIVFALFAFVGVFISFHTLNGPDAGTALLILLAALKLMEAKGLRDYFLLLVIALFVGIANFLHDQSIPLALYMIPALWLAITALLNIVHPDVERSLRNSVRSAGYLLLPALPIAAVLFLLFPRVPGPLWGIGLPQQSGVTGLSTSMSPGSLSQLAQSDAVAFRVHFNGTAPPPAQRYWRALVLHDYDGTTWHLGGSAWILRQQLETRGMPITYDVTLEANNLRVLYALDIPTRIPDDTFLTSDFELATRQPVTELKLYQVTSYPNYTYDTDLPLWRRQRDLKLPAGIDPRAHALASTWKNSAVAPQQIVNDALALFHDQPFSYTLQPGALTGKNRIDQFLFDTRRGFCEHYASAFVFLMRAAGIPAHVVVGYQGGTENPLDGYYVIRQEDAHAWAEVWLPGRGWVRVDPTAAVNPARVDQGVSAALPASELPGYIFERHPWLSAARNTLDAVNNGWNQWVLAYGPELQERFLTGIGLHYGDWGELALVLLILIGGLLAGISLVLWWRHRPTPESAVIRAYARFCRKLAKYGLPRASHEGPLDYARRINQLRPDLAVQIDAITSIYIALRYAEFGDQKSLQRLVRNFRI